MANIYDVAKLAGVSRSAVSRVLNNQVGVHPDKREKVLEAVRALNYRPNAMARGLAMQKTYTIGIVARELADPFYSEFIRSLNYFADEKHYGVLYCLRNSYLNPNVDYLSTLSAKVDGYIFLGENTVNEEELENLVKTNVPVVCMEFTTNVKGVTYLTIDNYEAVTRGMDFLLEQGHRKIVHVGLDPEVHEFEQREKAYQDCVFRNELGYSKVYRADYFVDHTTKLAREIYPTLKKDGATAVFCANDRVAVGVNEGFRQAGGQGEIEVLGFDGLFVDGTHSLPVTKFSTLRQPQEAMASYAIDSMIKMIEDRVTDYTKEFKCQLVPKEEWN